MAFPAMGLVDPGQRRYALLVLDWLELISGIAGAAS